MIWTSFWCTLPHPKSSLSLSGRSWRRFTERIGSPGLPHRVHGLKRPCGKPLRRPGEKIDILLATSRKEAMERSPFLKTGLVFLWSKEDRNWEPKLAAIPIDASVGTFDRGFFANLRLFSATNHTMRLVTRAINERVLKLNRTALSDIHLRLNTIYAACLDRWRESRAVGRDSLKVLPYGLHWLQRQPGQAEYRPQLPSQMAGISSHDFRHCVYLGRPFLHDALWVGVRHLERVCMIPHMRRGQHNEMFEFLRGPRHTRKRLAEIRDAREEIGEL